MTAISLLKGITSVQSLKDYIFETDCLCMLRYCSRQVCVDILIRQFKENLFLMLP